MRNTLAVLIILAVVASAGGYSIEYKLKHDVEVREAALTGKKTELDRLRSENQYFEEIEKRMIKTRILWKQMPKYIRRKENSSISFAYYNRLANRPDSDIEYNYSLSGSEKDGALNINSYTLVGEGRFSDLYTFIWKLEHFPPLYKIGDLEIKPVPVNYSDENFSYNKVNFIMTIDCFSTDQDGFEERNNISRPVPERIRVNPFYPLVREELPPNDDELLEVKNVSLIGLTSNTAFLRDREGKTWILRCGDRVYLGNLTGIFSKKNAVEFTLNEGGLVKKVRLQLFTQNKGGTPSGAYHE